MSAGNRVFLPLLILVMGAPCLAQERERYGDDAQLTIVGVRSPIQLHPQLNELLSILEQAAEGERPTLDLEELRTRRNQQRDPGTSSQLEQLRADARQNYLDFDFMAAKEALQSARAILLDGFADLLADELLLQVDFELASVLLDMGDREAAMNLLAEIAHVSPGVAPSTDDYSPRLLSAWSDLHESDSPPPTESEPRWRERLLQLGAALSVDLIISGQLTANEEGALSLELILLDSANGELINRGQIQLGPPESWNETLSEAVHRLLSPTRPPPPPPPERGRILVLSNPDGAEIAVDGIRIADRLTPALIETSPGSHFLSVSLDNHESVELRVNAWAHQTLPIEVELTPLEERNRSLWWVWTLVGLVVTGAGIGLILWGVEAAGERPDATVNVVRPELTWGM